MYDSPLRRVRKVDGLAHDSVELHSSARMRDRPVGVFRMPCRTAVFSAVGVVAGTEALSDVHCMGEKRSSDSSRAAP